MEFKICRVCLDKTATISLFRKQDDVPYCVKIMRCTKVEIAEGDGFPDAICEGCAADVAVSFEFAQRCEASDRTLRCLGLLQTADSHTNCNLQIKEEKVEPTEQESLIDYTHSDTFHDDISENLTNTVINHNTTHSDTFLDNIHETLTETEEKTKTKVKRSKKEIFKKSSKVLPHHIRVRKRRLKTGPLQCLICGRVVRCHSAFELHMRTHTKEKPFTCDICKKSFSNKYTLKIHIFRHYGIDIKSNKINIKQTDKRRNRPKKSPVQCSMCGLMFASQSAMDCHMRTHTGEKPFACDVCGSKYALKGGLKRHLATRHPDKHPNEFKKYTCDYCGKTFRARSGIVVHLRIHTGYKPYHCPLCPKKFSQINGLIHHKRWHIGEQPFKCDTCGRAFISKCMLKKHMVTHSDVRNYSCQICNKAFKSKNSVRAHMNTHNKSKFWVCSICGMTFTFKGNMQTHMARKHSEKSGTCTVCNKEFSDLTVHMRTHTGEKPHVCKICNQGFISDRSLSHHIGFKHRDIRKFKCTVDECDQGFPSMPMLRFHVLKMHSKSKPYVCCHCSRGFFRVCDLSKHLRVYHMDTETKVKSQFIKTY